MKKESYNSGTVYMLFDNPGDKDGMSFLLEHETASIKQKYPDKQLLSVKSMAKFCQKCIRNSANGDTIICWYDFMGVLCWWLCKLQHKRRKIVVLNILLKDKNTAKNRVARFLYKQALKSKTVEFTVTSKEYGEWLDERLGLNKKYYILHDIFHDNYEMKKTLITQKNSVFCGGRNGRDWSFLLDIAKCMPTTQFNCVMSKEDYEKHAASFGKNVNANYDISQDEFIRMLSESELVIMPLDTDAPAGLIAIFQAAANNKMIIASNTMTTREYLGKGRGCLCRKNVDEWVNKIEYYCENPEKARTCASEFKAFLENECSEKNYAEVLAQITK